MPTNNSNYVKAQRHLSRRDPVLKQMIKQYGHCTLQPDGDYFGVLVRAIVSQQISAKAAISISTRLAQSLGRKGITVKTILDASDDTLQQAGLSTAKRRFVKDLAAKVHSREVNFKKIADLSDEEVIAHLLPVQGIGRWTAEMFLIFALGRQDVLPLADLGLRAGIRRQYNIDDMPKDDHLRQIAEPWRPYRSIATWYIWRSFGNVPQSGPT